MYLRSLTSPLDRRYHDCDAISQGAVFFVFKLRGRDDKDFDISELSDIG